MPKKTTSKKVAKPRLPKVNKWVLGLIIILLPFLIYFLIVRPLQINHQRNQFKKAEVQLNSLADQIQAKIGKADQVKIETSCDRANIKFSKGPLVCDSSTYLTYKNIDPAKASLFMAEVAKLGTGSLRSGSSSALGQEFRGGSLGSIDQIFYQNFTSIENLACAFSYDYPTGGDLQKNLKIGAGCSGPAMAEIYPAKN
jgi:preprotein translocase subunit YajC